MGETGACYPQAADVENKDEESRDEGLIGDNQQLVSAVSERSFPVKEETSFDQQFVKRCGPHAQAAISWFLSGSYEDDSTPDIGKTPARRKAALGECYRQKQSPAGVHYCSLYSHTMPDSSRGFIDNLQTFGVWRAGE
jgi:hypothetical protein